MPIEAENTLIVPLQRRKTPPQQKIGYPEYDTQKHLREGFQFWRFEDYRATLHFHYSQVHSDLKVKNLEGFQINLFANYLYSIEKLDIM